MVTSPEADREAKAARIKVHVAFPVSRKEPYEAEDPRKTTVDAVRVAAMEWFEVSDGSQFKYVLTHAGHDVPGDRTIGELVGHEHEVKFQLVKKITQGA